MLNDDRAAQTAKTLWLKTKTEFTGNWRIDLDDQAIIVNAFAAELSKAYAEGEAMTDDRAAKKAEELLPWETFSCETADEETWQQLADGIAAELAKAYGEIASLRAELASVEQFAESWPCHCAENYPGATMYHGPDCQTAIAIEFVAQWRAAKVKP